jgi:hypothetical protein
MEISLWSDIQRHAELLNSIDKPDPNPVVGYDNMSGGLMWLDELPKHWPSGIDGVLRNFAAIRTKMMLGEPVNELMAEFIQRCRQHFPNWIGLLPERFKATPELLAEYRRGDVSLRWCLRKMEREED